MDLGKSEGERLAAEVMARLRNGKRRVLVTGVPPGMVPTQRPQEPRPGFAPDKGELQSRLRAQFGALLTVDACAVACDQNGNDLRSSIFVVAVVPTSEEADAGLLDIP